MAHKRQQILDHIRDDLIQSGYFKTNVWTQQALPKRAIFPCAIVYFTDENINTETIHDIDRPQYRTANLVVSAIIKGSPDDEQTIKNLNKASEIVETVISNNTQLFDDIRLTEVINILDEIEPEIPRIEHHFTCEYITSEKVVN